MTARAARPPLTAAQFLNLADTRGYELVDGRLKEKAMGMEATWIQGELLARVREVVRPARLGFVFGADCMYQCFPHKPEQVRKPDFSFVRAGRLPGDVLPKGPCPVPPDLIAEVISPKERVYDIQDKLDDFARAGVPLMWVVIPRGRRVQVYRDGRLTADLTAADELTGEPVLPGFRVPVADLFPPAGGGE
jgi:Uma2 family endonuclease